MPAVPKPSFPKKPKKRMAKFNAKRGGHKFPQHVDHDLRAFIRGLPCLLREKVVGVRHHECVGVVHVAHVKSRGAGGADRNNVVPLCWLAHQSQHLLGLAAFEQRWDVSLRAIARQLTAAYEAEKFPCP